MPPDPKPKNAEDELFKNAPVHAKKLLDESRRLKREQDRKAYLARIAAQILPP